MRPRHLFAALVILPTFTAFSPTPVRADTFGCTVLLCMLNPQGWASVPYCVPPVQTALALAAKRRPWPQCPEVNMPAQPDKSTESTELPTQDVTTGVPLRNSAAP